MRTFHRVTLAAFSAAVAGIVVAAMSGPINTAEGTVLRATHRAVPNSYIVTLASDASIGALADTYHAKVRHVYRTAIRGFSATMTAAQARRLAADPRVLRVEEDAEAYALGTQLNPPSWGLDRIDQRLGLNNSYTYPNRAASVTAYVIDTGIDLDHPEFGRIGVGIDVVGDGRNGDDCNGHGTAIAGIIGGENYGVAKDVKLVSVRVLGCSGSGTISAVLAGVDWVTANAVKPAVANMSLGGVKNQTIDNAVARSIASGVTYSVAAGGSNFDACQFSPAGVPEAVTVGATDSSDRRASFSNYGPCLDIFAPGVNIATVWLDAGNIVLSGTSFAAAHVTGAAAMILEEHPDYTPAQVTDALITNSTKDVVQNPGSGSPNRLLYVG